ncbi:MAG: hypothetical protein LBE91_16860 [Tannerella sp.]|jgi:hypothetical protein|nr:hypothetical protein [Tannerella sp.]
MIQKTGKKYGQKFIREAGRIISKVNTSNREVNRAYAQFRGSGILFAPANGKLYFAFPKIFSGTENDLPKNASEVAFLIDNGQI